MHLHLAPHLGTLDEPREGRDIEAKPKDGRTLECMYCRILGKPRSILSLLYFYKYQIKLYMVDAFGCRSWMKTLYAYIFLVQIYIYLELYVGPGSNIYA
jgi:hypothetical protein